MTGGSFFFDGRRVVVAPDALAVPLAETLRAHGHTSVKMPCGEGICGGCTVLVDGRALASCVLPTARAVGTRVQGAQELTCSDAGAALATQLGARGGLQCGFCIPGLVASASALLADGPSDKHVREQLSGHLCRCTGYEGIVGAVTRAAAGQPVAAAPRVDGAEKARGTLRYTADHLAGVDVGTLTGLLLTSRSPHALIRIEPGDALDVPGAVRVLGPDDAPAARFCTNPHVEDPVLAPKENAVFAREARFVGDIVGLVVATSPSAAREMARRVRQIEEPLPACLDTATARSPQAPRVRLADVSNVAFELAVGAAQPEVDAVMAAAHHVVSHRFEVGSGPVAAMERPAALARWDAAGTGAGGAGDALTVWSTSQTPQVVRHRLADLLGLDADAVSIEAVPLGGGFGLKEEHFLEPVAAVASRACGGRPVLVEVTRAQLGSLRRRHSGTVVTTTGCAADGTMLGRRVEVELDAGGEVGHSALILENALLIAATLYPVAPTRATGAAVLTNTPSAGAFRGYGAMEVAYALESHVDELARSCGIDPVEYRRRHVLRAGQTEALNQWPVASFASLETLEALDAAGADPLPRADPSGRWRRGRGTSVFSIVSAASSVAHLDSAAARCRVDPDGLVVVETAVPDMGQGLHTTFATVAAERLGVGPHRVRVCQQNSTDGPVDEGSFASRGVYVSSNALAAAADQLLVAIAEKLGVGVDDLTTSETGVTAGADTVAWPDLAGLSSEVRVASQDNGLVIGGQLADVSVDTWTGRVVVDRVVSVHDVGRVLDRRLARGQVVGGVVQGIGVALTERGRYADGACPDANLLDQGLPTMLVEPRIDDVFVGDGHARGTLRAKGLGEAPLVGVPAAVGNAIRDALGVRLTELPFTPERVLAAWTSRG